MFSVFPELLKHIEASDSHSLALATRRLFAGPKPFDPKLNIDTIISSSGIFHKSGESNAVLVEDQLGKINVHFGTTQSLDSFSRDFAKACLLGTLYFRILPAVASGDWTRGGFKIANDPLKDLLEGAVLDVHEERAARFALNLFVPEAMLTKATEKLGSQDALASFFGVPNALLAVRLAPASVAKHQSQPQQPSKGLQRIRELARQIDRSVE